MTVEILISDLLADVPHGFFTRRGGISTGIFSSLNCGAGSTDQKDAVIVNKARVAETMDGAPNDLVTVHQVHSAKVIQVDRQFEADAVPQADALVTTTPGLILGVLTADCQPVLFADTNVGVVGAAHAGWRGALDGVLEATMDMMVSLGASRENTTAVIGPCISQAAYEVGQELLDEFEAVDTDNTRYFAHGENGKYQFDLPGFSLNKLHNAGVAHAEWCRYCTYLDQDRFFSYRRSTHNGEPDYGRMISTIGLPKA